MEQIELKAFAKINLCLYITGIRQDGYHELDSVFQSVGLFDIVRLKKANDISVACDQADIPCDQTNSGYRAAERFIEKTGISGAAIHIHKKIPSSAGLGGGSADAAAVLVGLNALYSCGLSDNALMDIGIQVGADVPFFINGGCQRARGIGEVLSPLLNPFDFDIVIIKPKGGVSTPEAYRHFDNSEKPGGSALVMIEAMGRKDEDALLGGMENALEAAAFKLAPESKRAVDALYENGARKACVTGSGSAVFGLFKNGLGADAEKALNGRGFESVFLTKKTNQGVLITDPVSPDL